LVADKPAAATGMRLDKWLWVARFFKTRALATDEIDKGRIAVNGQNAKPSRELRIGDTVHWRQSGWTRIVVVRGLSLQRGPAPVAQALYEDTPESLNARELARQQQRFGVEPAQDQAHGRPTKRDRRDLSDWQRWSVSIDDSPADPERVRKT
jgi:ribosome-associated heat shock protein Hsp15